MSTTVSTSSLRSIAELPGPRPLPLVGNALALGGTQLHRVLETWNERHGPLFAVKVGTKRMVILSDPKLQGEILRARPDLYRRVATIQSILDELRVQGVFSAEGSAWRPQRKLAMEALAPKNLRTFFPSLLDVASRLRARWERAAAEDRSLDLLDELKRVTVDVTSRLVFGHDLDTLGNTEKDPLSILIEPLFPAINRRMGALVPYWRWLRLPKDREVDRSLDGLFGWLRARLESARAALREHPERAESPTTFLEAMVLATDENGEPFSDLVILGNALTMLVAGEDTTANTLAWAIHHLCDEDRARTELLREVDVELVDGAGLRDLEHASSLVYTGAVAQEAMRLRPVAPLLFLEPLQDVVLGDVAVPQGSTVVLLMRPPAVSSRIVDATSFVPERWLASTPAERRIDGSIVLPFGSGPRICPGRSLALLELRVILATIYRHFEVERLVPAAAVEEHFAFSMTPTQLPVRVRRHAR